MKIKLESDFLDYYDHWFAGRWETADAVLDRRSRTELSRESQFWIMEQQGLHTPYHGYLPDAVGAGFDLDAYYVVYTDPYAHRGEGKVRVSLREAYKKYPDAYCSKWVSGSYSRRMEPMSYRLLGVGDQMYTLRYEGSPLEWRSNYGDGVDVTWERGWGIEDQVDFNSDNPFPEYPLWAVDFVSNQWGELVAVDFNTAPQIRGTGIEDGIRSEEIYEAVEKKMWRRMLR